MRHDTVLVDTNVMIEAVRTGLWSALTGRVSVETVVECEREARAGDETSSGYVLVSDQQIARLARVHAVSIDEQAAFALAYALADGMDPGERDLFAHAFGRSDEHWLMASPDRAAIRGAMALGWNDRLGLSSCWGGNLFTRPSPVS